VLVTRTLVTTPAVAGKLVVVEVGSESLELPVADGTTLPAYASRPSGQPRPVGVVVGRELFGVSPEIRRVDLAGAGHLAPAPAPAPAFYHRLAPPGRWLERDESGRSEGFDYLHRLGREHALADVEAALGWLNAQPGIEQTAIVGFSAGGHLAYLAACRLPIARAAVLDGGWLPSTAIPMSRPTPTLSLTPGITGRLVYLVGDRDTLIARDERDQIRAALSDAGVDHELVVYPDTEHAFFWPGTLGFADTAHDDAWHQILRLITD
jgi:carboxymethylenebutenolidase